MTPLSIAFNLCYLGGTVISELRNTQRLLSSSPGDGSPPTTPSHRSEGPALPVEIIHHCVDFFFANVYPTQPILHRAALSRSISSMQRDVESYCLVTSLCAYMMIQPDMRLPASPDLGCSRLTEPSSETSLGTSLLLQALQARKESPYCENPSVSTITTSFFFFGCYFCLEKQGMAWFHLREASTLALLNNMHQEDTYKQGDPVQSMLRRRLFWLLFVTER